VRLHGSVFHLFTTISLNEPFVKCSRRYATRQIDARHGHVRSVSRLQQNWTMRRETESPRTVKTLERCDLQVTARRMVGVHGGVRHVGCPVNNKIVFHRDPIGRERVRLTLAYYSATVLSGTLSAGRYENRARYRRKKIHARRPRHQTENAHEMNHRLEITSRHHGPGEYVKNEIYDLSVNVYRETDRSRPILPCRLKGFARQTVVFLAFQH
jgi:hypothetical protein